MLYDNAEDYIKAKQNWRENTKQCLVQDESSHWYCIPVFKREQFDRWVYDEDYSESFDEYRLNMHISNYSFENFGEIKT